MNITLSAEALEEGTAERLSIKVANRDLYQADFISLLADNDSAPEKPTGGPVIERTRDGQCFGKPVGVEKADGESSAYIST
ncbi:hypothetical protein O4H53_27080, partial [Sulfitobacter sp. G21635-S1]|uniref:hypothetical protein n=1 Tax=Sulfitobacter sp. G21635-S1 TaxID=3014043 RepID=UPI0022B0665D